MSKAKSITRCMLAGLVMLFFWAGPGFTGDLEPPGPPAPTMKPLSEVEPRTAITSLPYQIDYPGSYYLAGDLSSATEGIIIATDDVTVDLMGYSLVGLPGSNIGINMSGKKNVEIRNGTIRNFGQTGLYAYGGTGARVIDIRAMSNGNIGLFLNVEYPLVKNCKVAYNGRHGIQLGEGALIEGNVVYGNGWNGIMISGGGKSVIVNNVSFNNSTAAAGYQDLWMGCTTCAYFNNISIVQ